MPRQLYFACGVLAMAGVLGVAIFGSVGHLADPYAARGTIAGVFLAMQYQRFVCRPLMTRHVVGSSLVAAILASVLARALWFGPITNPVEEAAEIAVSALAVVALMVASFHCLTLGRGRMAL